MLKYPSDSDCINQQCSVSSTNSYISEESYVHESVPFPLHSSDYNMGSTRRFSETSMVIRPHIEALTYRSLSTLFFTFRLLINSGADPIRMHIVGTYPVSGP